MARAVMPRQGPRLDSDLAMQVSVLGTTDSSLSEEFQSGLYRLEQGRHISGDGDNVLVHRDFAMQNGLSVGSTFRLRQEGRNATVRVAGIFSGNVQAQSPLPSDTSENLIYSGRRVASALTGNDRIDMIRCLSDNPQDLSAAIGRAKTMAGGKYDVTDDSARLSASCNPCRRCVIWCAWCCCPSASRTYWCWRWRWSSGFAHASMR